VKFHIPDSYGEFLENGFVKENDVFERKKIADSLSSIIATSDDPLVICLDAPWGEGKTSFLHMWMHQLEEKHIPVVYFDAFAHDHHQDPFIPISSAIYEYAKDAQMPGDQFVKGFATSIGKVMKVGAKTGLKFLGRAVAYKFLGEGDFSKIADGIAEDIAHEAEEIGNKVLGIYQEQEMSLEAVRIALASLAADLLAINKAKYSSDSKNIVFIVDELDRCKPDFALALIEMVKHIFSTQHVTFVLSVNKTQLGCSLQGIYGDRFDADNYLDKFINITTSLPKLGFRPASLTSYTSYILNCAGIVGYKIYKHDAETLATYCKALNVPLRLINKAIINLGLYYTVPLYGDFRNPDVSKITMGMCVFKVAYPKLFDLLANQYVSRSLISENFFTEELKGVRLPNDIYQDWRCFINGPSNRDITYEHNAKSRWKEMSHDWGDLTKLLHDISQPLKYFSIT